MNKARLQGCILGVALAATGMGTAGTALAGSGWSIDDLHGPLATLDGKPPLIVAHRGLSGYFPEETRPAYRAAALAGADSLEEDLHLTKDCILVTRHNPWLSDNTNIAEVARTSQAVAARRRSVPGVLVNVAYPATPDNGPPQYLSDRTDPNDPTSVLRSLVVDGEDHTNDWSVTDFTLAELKQWIRGTTYDARDERPTALNGRVAILSFQEVIDIAKSSGARLGRTLSLYPETKNPYWNNAQAIANGCGAPGSHPLEDALIRILDDNGLNRRDAPVFVQSFDPASLKYLRSAGLKTRTVQLIDASNVDYRTGQMVYNSKDATTFVSGRPYSWTVAGDPRYFSTMLTPAGLAEIRTYADGIGPWKPMIVPLKIDPFPAANPDGTPYVGKTSDATTQPPTSLIEDAHKAGLFVHTFTFRNEDSYLASDYRGDPQAEYLKFYRLGIDGVFSDFSNTAFLARIRYLKETLR